MLGLLKVRVREEEEHLTELKDTEHLQTNFRSSPALVLRFQMLLCRLWRVRRKESGRQAEHLG